MQRATQPREGPRRRSAARIAGRLLAAVLVVALGGALGGCDATSPQQTGSQVVVEAYLEAGAPLPTVRLTRTTGADEPYRPSDRAIRGADVAVERLSGDDGAVVRSTSYRETDDAPGVYAPESAPVVRPSATYRLRVETPDGATVTSTTTVPDSIEVVRAENLEATYQSSAQPSLTIDPPRPPADRQSVYTFTTTSRLDFRGTPDSVLAGALTPFYRDAYEPADDSLISLRTTSSGLLNEANFERNANGTITVDLPWIAVAFYGPNTVSVNAVDDNYYDLLRSQDVQQGGGSAPGEIPNVIEHVDGGTGIFGSYVQATRRVEIRRPEG